MSETALEQDHESDGLLSARDVKKHFPVKGGILQRQVGTVRAVDGVSFDLESGRTLGLVGESGCGKSTLGKTLLRLHDPTDGRIVFDGEDITDLGKSRLREIRRNMQIIFQDPASSLNPRMTVSELIQEPMKTLTDWPKEERRSRTMELLDEVGLQEYHLHRAPHEFSGGQQQRVAIARALSVNPKLVVADEPTSALDVSVQAKILNLMSDLQAEYDLTYLFISHDLSVIKHICDEVAVMYLGQFVETATTDLIFDDPKHPYTRALMSAVPRASAERMADRIVIEGDVPSPENPPSGCRYHTRCQEYIGDVCETDDPQFAEPEDGQQCACHHFL